MDYAHARHAGNAGDVLKHVALMAVLEPRLLSTTPLINACTPLSVALKVRSAGNVAAPSELVKCTVPV